MNKFLTALLFLACAAPVAAQTNVRIRGTAPDGLDRNILANVDGRLLTDPGYPVTPVVSTVLGALVAKTSAGILYRASITTGASAGYIMAFNATSAPADGAVTPLLCRAVAANTSLSVSYIEAPATFTTGLTLVFSTTGCLTKTASATAFFEASVR